jgi:hypothetical protein
MTLPYVNLTKAEGSARPLASGASKALVIGPASSGVKETRLYPFGNTAEVASTIGYGNAQVAAELFMSLAPTGFGSVDVLVSSASNPGTVTLVGNAPSPTIQVTGTPYASYDVRAEVTTAGALGAGRYRLSLDGGNTYTEPLKIPLNGTGSVTNTGLSVVFGTGTHSVGNTSQYTVQGPGMTTTDLQSCLNTMSASNTNYTLILVADDQINPNSASGLFSTLDGHLTVLDNTYLKFTQGVVPVGGESKLFNRTVPTNGTYGTSQVLTAITSSVAATGNFISAVAERVNTYVASPFAGYSRPRLPFAFSYAAECHAVGGDLSRNPAATAIRRVEMPSYDEFQNGSVYHDEKIVAPRTFQGEGGVVFCNQALLKSAANSTYNLWPKARITSRAAEVLYPALRSFLNTPVRVLTDGTGKIDPRDAAIIETACTKVLNAALITQTRTDGGQGHVSGLSFTVSRENNVLSSGQIQWSLLIVPLAYITSIDGSIFLTDTLAVSPTT